eukprot:CAMPEP_0172552036 /NCGR_PEP_ID=MMETSP1067-20121228/43367_1 /TAXON_ID=265564 ORGANISM="Thalassiosira punctigera, Strain Tpunct2005C2" /NCGR_SAMPLE_ID=MMETSP1067 /ASSEMBLY_ACC=CAM_ASM_000444 /LENGTH=253 /DNA_ID=CAMNT_0013339945 /DNA_START=99 /DNA_END=860 /DNA_ORIENTATION=+
MHLKLLSLAALAGASSAAESGNLVRDRQMAETESADAMAMAMQNPTIGCLLTLGDKPLSACCPCADEGLCALFHCMDLETLSIREQCACGQIEGACTDVKDLIALPIVAPFGLKDACEGVNACCEAGVTNTTAANTCMAAALEASGETPPDLSALDALQPGLSGKITDLAASGTAACAEDKETSEEDIDGSAGNGTTTDGKNGTMTGGKKNDTDSTDYVPDPSGNQEPDAGSGAGALVASAALLVSALTLLVV